MFALATAYRWPCEQEETRGEPVGWQRWRRQLLEQTRDQVIVFGQACYGIFHMAEHSLRLGGTSKTALPRSGQARKSWPSTDSQRIAELISKFRSSGTFFLTTVSTIVYQRKILPFIAAYADRCGCSFWCCERCRRRGICRCSTRVPRDPLSPPSSPASLHASDSSGEPNSSPASNPFPREGVSPHYP
jgi:hypothetical protein